MARRYRTRLPDALRSVRIVQDERDQTRYHRVVVGTYETEGAARQARRRYREALPAGAWLVPLR
jgi:Tfp pilus assembly protein PilF